MRKEARIARCEKCNTVTYVHKHHIVKKSNFGKGQTIDLCANCHTKYHEYLNKQDVNPTDLEKNLYHWYTWYYTIVVIVVLGLIFKIFL